MCRSAAGRSGKDDWRASRSAAHPVKLTTPEGGILGTGSGASGDLIAAWRASNVDSVTIRPAFS
jgi:hypothetical protein